MENSAFDFSPSERRKIWSYLVEKLERHYSDPSQLRVAPPLDPGVVRDYCAVDFQTAVPPQDAIDYVTAGLDQFIVHTSHPGYYGLFNPRPAFAGIIADAITAVYNPQMAAWSHSPFAVEAENYVIREFGKKFGYRADSVDGTFTYAGAEANHTALLMALTRVVPHFAENGLAGSDARPVIYVSQESHHSFMKAAGLSGMGRTSVRNIIPGTGFTMDVSALRRQVAEDIIAGYLPVMVVSTIGTTGMGVIDPVKEIDSVAREYGMWHHADAAWGGAAAISSKYRHLVDGMELADSITFDAHKWMSVPMAAGMIITRHPEALLETFRITADYMPKEGKEFEIVDPFTHSIQWSRRFTGLKLFMAMLIYSWGGYEKVINSQLETGELLREKLKAAGWKIYNNTKLPVVNFGLADLEGNPEKAARFCRKVTDSGKVWISVYNTCGISTLRACITNYNTTEKDLNVLIDTLNQARK
ncbi:MAG: pyridoxal-dependent decarboxylase [Bacteroidales bacterium]|jgi:glutamate/tyrosine decarboxylase-like PLP-dependent enzyme|nr:pyridoxal-dependent decarboxylase [Bacteroidales bacterium]